MKKKKKSEVVSKKPEAVGRKPLAGVASWKWLVPVIAITFICYTPVLSDQKEFTNWDDPGYVTEQSLTQSLKSDNIKTLFRPETQVMLNYHPLTMVSLAIDYKRGYDEKTKKLDVTPFATTNLILHLLNTALVFFFLYSLSGKKIWVATIAALLFGIHPMHVESVAWVSERKDVLYCLFFLLSCLSYLKYLGDKKMIWLAATFAFFVLSCLSKAMAVPLPIVLLVIDLYYQRKINFRVLAEKIPFLLIALWLGYNAVQIQEKEAIAEFEVFSIGQRFMFASYGFVMYVVKMFAPFNLSAFYPYPSLDENGNIPPLFYLAPLIAIAAVVVPLLIFRRRDPVQFRTFLFGIGFYSLMVALVLQFVSVGQAVMADRYTYLPYIGLFFIVGMIADRIMSDPKKKNLVLAVFIGFSALFSWQSFQRVQVWHNSGVLWTDVIRQYPFVIEQVGNVVTVKEKGFETAYKNRGNWYADRQMYDSAFADYDVLARAATKDAGVWSNLGNVYALKGNFPKSLEAYSNAVKYNPNNLQTYLNRGLTYSNLGKNAEALADMDKALQLSPGLEQAHSLKVRSLLNLARYPETIEQCNSLLNSFPQNAELWFFRGTALINTSRAQEGINDINKAIQLNPSSGVYHYNIAFGYLQLGNKGMAQNHTAQAQKLGFQVPASFLEQIR